MSSEDSLSIGPRSLPIMPMLTSMTFFSTCPSPSSLSFPLLPPPLFLLCLQLSLLPFLSFLVHLHLSPFLSPLLLSHGRRISFISILIGTGSISGDEAQAVLPTLDSGFSFLSSSFLPSFPPSLLPFLPFFFSFSPSPFPFSFHLPSLIPSLLLSLLSLLSLPSLLPSLIHLSIPQEEETGLLR